MEDQEKTLKVAKEMAEKIQPEKARPSAAEARQILEQETQEKIQKCWQELGQLLQKYELQFDVATLLRGNSISHQINLVPAPPRQQNG